MPNIPLSAPRFVRIGRYAVTEKEVALEFFTESNERFLIELDISAVGLTVDALQKSLASDRGGYLLTLTPTRIDGGAAADRIALRVRTKEAGTIALELNDQLIDQLRVAIGDVASINPPTTKQ